MLLLLMGFGTIVHFSGSSVSMHQPQTPSSFQQRFGHFSTSHCNSLGFPICCSREIGQKSPPLSSSPSLMMATHLLHAPSEELGSSLPSLVIGEHDLLIVGPGVLGRLVAQKWRQEYPGCQVFGQTVTTDHHEELNKMGISPSLKWTKCDHKFPYVIFCAPPYQSSDYHGDVRQAALCWNGEGSFLYTSSSAPYDCNDNGLCDEDTPVVPIGRSPRTDVLLKAENIVLEFGGSVVRLSGLYKEDKGAHAYWLEKGIVDSRPDHILNLIHYEDAASLSVAILKKQFQGRIFLGCDNHPLSRLHASHKFYKYYNGNCNCFFLSEIYSQCCAIFGGSSPNSCYCCVLDSDANTRSLTHTWISGSNGDLPFLYIFLTKKTLLPFQHFGRQEVMDLVNKSGKFSKKFEKFTGTDDPLGKRLNNSRTRQEIGWEPKYSSFAHFLETI